MSIEIPINHSLAIKKQTVLNNITQGDGLVSQEDAELTGLDYKKVKAYDHRDNGGNGDGFVSSDELQEFFNHQNSPLALTLTNPDGQDQKVYVKGGQIVPSFFEHAILEDSEVAAFLATPEGAQQKSNILRAIRYFHGTETSEGSNKYVGFLEELASKENVSQATLMIVAKALIKARPNAAPSILAYFDGQLETIFNSPDLDLYNDFLSLAETALSSTNSSEVAAKILEAVALTQANAMLYLIEDKNKPALAAAIPLANRLLLDKFADQGIDSEAASAYQLAITRLVEQGTDNANVAGLYLFMTVNKPLSESALLNFQNGRAGAIKLINQIDLGLAALPDKIGESDPSQATVSYTVSQLQQKLSQAKNSFEGFYIYLEGLAEFDPDGYNTLVAELESSKEYKAAFASLGSCQEELNDLAAKVGAEGFDLSLVQDEIAQASNNISTILSNGFWKNSYNFYEFAYAQTAALWEGVGENGLAAVVDPAELPPQLATTYARFKLEVFKQTVIENHGLTWGRGVGQTDRNASFDSQSCIGLVYEGLLDFYGIDDVAGDQGTLSLYNKTAKDLVTSLIDNNTDNFLMRNGNPIIWNPTGAPTLNEGSDASEYTFEAWSDVRAELLAEYEQNGVAFFLVQKYAMQSDGQYHPRHAQMIANYGEGWQLWESTPAQHGTGYDVHSGNINLDTLELLGGSGKLTFTSALSKDLNEIMGDHSAVNSKKLLADL